MAFGRQKVQKQPPQAQYMCGAPFALFLGQLQGRGQSDNEGHGFCAGPPAVLLMTAEQLRPATTAATKEQPAHALRAMKLVGAEGERGNAQVVKANADSSHCLHRVAMERASGTGLGQFGDGLDGPGFVVGEHHADEPRLRAPPLRQRIQNDDAGRVHGQPGYGKAVLFENAHRLGHRRMLDGADQERRRRRASQPENSQIVGFGASAGKDDLVRKRIQDGGDALAGFFQRLAGAAAGRVGAGRVAVMVREKRPHGFPYSRQDWGGRVVVQVDRIHGTASRGSRGRKAAAGVPWHSSVPGEPS